MSSSIYIHSEERTLPSAVLSFKGAIPSPASACGMLPSYMSVRLSRYLVTRCDISQITSHSSCVRTLSNVNTAWEYVMPEALTAFFSKIFVTTLLIRRPFESWLLTYWANDLIDPTGREIVNGNRSPGRRS